MKDKDLYFDNHTGMAFGSYIELYAHSLYNGLRKKGGCDGTDEITNWILTDLPYNEDHKELIDCLNAKKCECDCMAFAQILGYISILHPQGKWPMIVMDPFCDSFKKQSPATKVSMEKLKKNMSASIIHI